MSKSIRDSVNETLLRTIGISYDEYEMLDFEEKQKLISEYHKKNPDKSKETIVMIGGGDESIFMRVPKGEKIWTPNGYFIAGETLEENKKRFEERILNSDKRWKELNKRLEKDIKKSEKLDFKTWLYLYITHVVKVTHPVVVPTDDKRRMYVKDSKKNEVYVFRSYEEYKQYFLMYLDSVEEDLIDIAIYTRGKNGQIVAFKGLCEKIIIKKKMNEIYQSITEEQRREIHAKGKLTPDEAVEVWEKYDLCVEGSKGILAKSRCDFFDGDCHTCLMESASHKLEHDDIELSITNSPITKKLTND